MEEHAWGEALISASTFALLFFLLKNEMLRFG